MPKPKVLLGMSGGVDSSVSAVLLLEQGYEVIGGFMKNWSPRSSPLARYPSPATNPPPFTRGETEGGLGGEGAQGGSKSDEFDECGWKTERRDAMRVAAQLGIPFVTFDFEKEYRRDVVEYLFAEFEAGRTPNPDVMCNRYVKFDLFLKEADKLGCSFIATGHYARTSSPFTKGGDRGGSEIKGSDAGGHDAVRILKGIDENKDQTYFLWAINKNVLSRVLFPIGHLTKSEVRRIAREHNLVVADKKDSTGICFVGEVDMPEFLKARMKEDPGNVVTSEGKIVGTHIGINFYTIGQRHGLKIGGGDPYYVVEKHRDTNEIVVGSNFHPALFRRELTASQLNWFRAPSPFKGEPCLPAGRGGGRGVVFKCEARIRHRQPVQKCLITLSHLELVEGSPIVHVTFDELQRAITPGQSIVFYDGNVMLGGGIIDDF